MSYKRIATRLGIIVGSFAILVAAYLFYLFNSNSKLIMLVPENADEVLFFNTRNAAGQLQDSTTQFVKLVEKIKNLPYLTQCSDASEPGIYLYSEIIYYSTVKLDKKFNVVLIKLNDGEKLKSFITSKVDRKLLSMPEKLESLYFSAFINKNCWLVWNKNIAAFVQTEADENLRIPFFQHLFDINNKTPDYAKIYTDNEKKLHGWYVNKKGNEDSGEIGFKNFSFYFSKNNLIFEGQLLKPAADLNKRFTYKSPAALLINIDNNKPVFAQSTLSPGIRIGEEMPIYSIADIQLKNGKATAQISTTNKTFTGFDVLLGILNHNIPLN